MDNTITTTTGIILSLNGTDLTLSPTTALADASANGISFALSSRVQLGSAMDLSNFLTTNFDAPALPSSDSLPGPIKSVYDKLTSLQFTVEELRLKVPPNPAAGAAQTAQTSFTLAMSATWAAGDEIALLGNALKIKGVYVRVVKPE